MPERVKCWRGMEMQANQVFALDEGGDLDAVFSRKGSVTSLMFPKVPLEFAPCGLNFPRRVNRIYLC